MPFSCLKARGAEQARLQVQRRDEEHAQEQEDRIRKEKEQKEAGERAAKENKEQAIAETTAGMQVRLNEEEDQRSAKEAAQAKEKGKRRNDKQLSVPVTKKRERMLKGQNRKLNRAKGNKQQSWKVQLLHAQLRKWNPSRLAGPNGETWYEHKGDPVAVETAVSTSTWSVADPIESGPAGESDMTEARFGRMRKFIGSAKLNLSGLNRVSERDF